MQQCLLMRQTSLGQAEVTTRTCTENLRQPEFTRRGFFQRAPNALKKVFGKKKRSFWYYLFSEIKYESSGNTSFKYIVHLKVRG